MREDIQCLRGIAILFVFLFHLYPTTFVNGFLGVDMFFVISGFLMARALSRGLEGPMDFVKFYYRRFRRILPLYYLMIFVTVISVHLYLGDYLWDNNNRYSLASILLVTNQLVIYDSTDYFNEFNVASDSVNVFLHLWSLSCEMQFYLLVPFIFLAFQVFRKDYIKMILSALVTIGGFIAFAMADEKVSFNFMLLRLWQFASGFVAMYWIKIKSDAKKELPEKSEKSEEPKFQSPITREDLITVSLVVIFCGLLPNKINPLVLRPLVTLASAIVIAVGAEHVLILKLKWLSYIGDISYVMYLVHWPVIAIASRGTLQSYFFCILMTLLLSILIHHLYEKRYLQMEWKAMIPFLLGLILFNAYLQTSVRKHSFWKFPYSPEIQEIVDKNQALLPFSWAKDPMAKECLKSNATTFWNLQGDNWGFGKCPTGNGPLSVMVMGNSYSMTFRDPIRKQFQGNHSSFRYLTIRDGYAIYADNQRSHKAMGEFKKHVKAYRPDVLFITVRFSNTIKRNPVQENDFYVKQINENIAFYEKFVKKIYILAPFQQYKSNFINLFLQNVVNYPEKLEELHLNKRKADQEMRLIKKRFSMVKCKKCKFFDLSHFFVESDKYLSFDRDQMISYMDNTIHLTKAALDVCQPELKRIVDEAMNTVQ